MLISRCVEDISRYAAGDMDLQHTTETLINDMDRTETLGIRSFIINNSRAIRRRLFPDLEDFEHIGYDGWKQNVSLGKRNNQNFVSIPFEMLISMLRYKSERQGLRFVEINESHTSKCSSFDLEPVCHHDTYVGRRVRRGLFKTRDGILINADINGSYNIMRKVKGDAAMPPHTGFGYNPVKKFIN